MSTATLRCQACRRIITQDEADRAVRIFKIVGDSPEGTHCPDCAKSFSDGDTDPNAWHGDEE